MVIHNPIKKQNQIIARCEKSLALEKLQKRRADTRRKIELGGLVIKSGIETHDKSILLGALAYAKKLIEQNPHYEQVFKSIGDKIFLN
ncbi:conjugal transfer protein TraD [Legionella sp.]|uniref:conjugal transfer protein TraD n=1 Tax=Legionella sp. TaxID=459 RepID=UPI003CB280EC